MKKFIIIFSPIFITAIFISLIIFKKTVKSSPSFQALTPSVGMNTTLKTSPNTAVVEIKHDNSRLGLETPLREVSLIKNNEEYVYQSKKDEMEIIYKPIDKGIKEEIILHKLPDLNKFSEPGSDFVEFSINMILDNLSWGTNVDDLPIFFDESGKYQFHFQKPFAQDAKGETTTSLVYEIIPDRGFSLPPKIQTRLPYLKPAITRGRKVINALKLGVKTKVFAQTVSPNPQNPSISPSQRKKYTLVLSINKAWLSDTKRVFPVIIDPSVVNDPASAHPEIIEKRTTKSRVFLKNINDNQNLIGVFTIHDQNYRDESGAWQRVDETLGDNEDFDGYAYEAKSMEHIVKVKGDGERKWYPRRNIKDEYVIIGKAESLTENNEELVLPLGNVAKTRGKISWENDNYSLNFTQNWRKIKFDIVLKNQNAPASFRWPVTFNKLTWEDWTIKSKETIVARMIKPTAQDSSGKGVNLEVDFKDGYLTIKADTKDAKYPIIIDPTFTTQPDATAGKDTCVAQATPLNNNGTFVVIYTRYDAAAQINGLLEFDLSERAATDICNSATLSLYVNYELAAPTRTATVYSVSVANENWIEGTKGDATAGTGEPCWTWKAYNTVAWAGSAGLMTSGTDYEAAALGTLTVVNDEPVGTEISTALTAARVKDWFSPINTNYGVLLLATAGADKNYFSSSDYGTAAQRPKLVVDYTLGGGASLNFEGVNMEGVKID